jgi:hypothetical protein
VRTDRHADCGGDTCSCAVVNILERKMEWLAFVRLPGMLAAKIRALQQGAQDQGSCEEIKMLGSGIEICCKSTTGSLRSRFL